MIKYTNIEENKVNIVFNNKTYTVRTLYFNYPMGAKFIGPKSLNDEIEKFTGDDVYLNDIKTLNRDVYSYVDDNLINDVNISDDQIRELCLEYL